MLRGILKAQRPNRHAAKAIFVTIKQNNDIDGYTIRMKKSILSLPHSTQIYDFESELCWHFLHTQHFQTARLVTVIFLTINLFTKHTHCVYCVPSSLFIKTNMFPTDGHQWLTSCPSHFNPKKEPLYPYVEGWVGPRVGMDVLEKRKIFCPYQDLNPGPSTVAILAMLPCPQTGKQLKKK